MTTLALGPVIGKIGGGVDVIPFAITLSQSGEQEIITTLEVDEGDRWLVAWAADLDFDVGDSFQERYSPRVWIGSQQGNAFSARGRYRQVAEVTETSQIRFVLNYDNTTTLTGHLVTARIP